MLKEKDIIKITSLVKKITTITLFLSEQMLKGILGRKQFTRKRVLFSVGSLKRNLEKIFLVETLWQTIITDNNSKCILLQISHKMFSTSFINHSKTQLIFLSHFGTIINTRHVEFQTNSSRWKTTMLRLILFVLE